MKTISERARERESRAVRLPPFRIPLDPYPSSFKAPDLVLTSPHACSGSAVLHRSLLVFLCQIYRTDTLKSKECILLVANDVDESLGSPNAPDEVFVLPEMKRVMLLVM